MNRLFWRRKNSQTLAAGGKRILILNWRDTKHQQAGGAEVYAHELARRWQQMGHQVSMFCGNDGKSLRHETIDGVTITRRGSFYGVYVWAFVYYLLRYRRQTDIIVDCHNGIPFFTPLYSRKPIYCVVHHVHQEVFKQFMRPLGAKIAGFMERTAMPFVYGSRQYITVSQSSKDAMITQLGITADNIEIVYNGINIDNFGIGAKAENPTILYLGRLKAYKSVDVLIRAFARVVQAEPQAALIIAGTGDAEDDLQRLVRKLGLEKKVQFFGYVSEADKVRLLQNAWVFCSPSYAEGWGITVIEANACGTPVVASDVPGLCESVQAPNSGFLVPYGDVDAFADKLAYLIHDKKTQEAMSRSAYQWAATFNWQTSATKFLEIIL